MPPQDGLKAMPFDDTPSQNDLSSRLQSRLTLSILAVVSFAGLIATLNTTSYGRNVVATVSYLSSAHFAFESASDFYAQPGMLLVNRSEAIDAHRHARWMPLTQIDALERQNMTGLEASFQLEDGFSLMDEYIRAYEGDAAGEDVGVDLDYLKDKTILLFGDSQDRYTIDYLCELMHGDLSYRNFFTRTLPQHDLSRKGWQSDWRNALHHCQLPPFLGNTTVWSFMTYGSISTNETWYKMRANQGPDELLERIELAGNAFRESNIVLDLTVFHTMLWDLSTANLFDTYDDKPAASSLSIEQVQHFRRRQEAALHLASESFPLASDRALMYRTLHDTRPKEGTWFYVNAPAGAQRISRAPLANNKGAQLQSIMLDTIADFDVTPLDLGRVLAGYVEDFPDDRHFGPVGRLLYTQMLLYYLKQATNSRSALAT